MKKRIVINITSSANWRRRPVGIIRVERELTKHIYQLYPEHVVPVILEVDTTSWKTGSWRTVKQSCFQDIISDEWVSENLPDSSLKNDNLTPFRPSKDDSFVSVGSDWSFDIAEKVAKAYGNSRVMVPACYDLIPLLLPEFTPGAEFFDQFLNHYTHIAHYAKSVFAISENSKKDLLEFWNGRGLLKIAPPVKVIPLAAPDNMGKLSSLDDTDQSLLENIQQGGEYIIYVSTLEPRKNHQMLLEIWRELFIERGQNCPRLLMVGMKGWGNDLIQQMDRMNATRARKIVWIQNISDNLLCHLYSKALFAVFPSYYEGWGLAATEAAAFGKVCVVSDNSALREAAHGLTPSYHPLDFHGWSHEIKKLIDDIPYRKTLEKRVLALSPKRTWKDFAKDFCDQLL